MFIEALIQALRQYYFYLLAVAPLAAAMILALIEFLTGFFGVAE